MACDGDEAAAVDQQHAIDLCGVINVAAGLGDPAGDGGERQGFDAFLNFAQAVDHQVPGQVAQAVAAHARGIEHHQRGAFDLHQVGQAEAPFEVDLGQRLLVVAQPKPRAQQAFDRRDVFAVERGQQLFFATKREQHEEITHIVIEQERIVIGAADVEHGFSRIIDRH